MSASNVRQQDPVKICRETSQPAQKSSTSRNDENLLPPKLKYAVKPVSPPRNLAPQETTKIFSHLKRPKYSTAYMPQRPPTDYQTVKSTRSSRCSRSEPKRLSRKKWTQLEESIVNHPNFEKAAALIQMLGDDRFDANTQHPHRIGSLPSGRTPFAPTTDVQTIEAAVNIVRDVIEAKEARKQTEKEEEEEFEELEEEEELPEGKGRFKRRQISVPAENLNLDRPDESKSVKPYVINIYLDTKQGKVFKDTDLKEKIKEFWEEQHKSAGKEEEIEEADEAPARNPRKNEVKDYLSENEVKDYLSESVPRYQIENIAKMYPDPTSTANPHTERLESGAPANYDINKKIKEVIATVTPPHRAMWNKKQEAKEAEERLAAEIPEDDPPKQAMKRIENDEVFMKNQNKNQNQRHYSTFPQPYSNVFIAPDDSLKCKSKATTHLQIIFSPTIQQCLHSP
ncbi:hypothetical protein QE152_g7017 [Popillia japonica]|uniref:Uncharacterized protein n=1 Tax=Popillia japonica TaxID=7064 RepID=A0AAW1MCC9_POPJA